MPDQSTIEEHHVKVEASSVAVVLLGQIQKMALKRYNFDPVAMEALVAALRTVSEVVEYERDWSTVRWQDEAQDTPEPAEPDPDAGRVQTVDSWGAAGLKWTLSTAVRDEDMDRRFAVLCATIYNAHGGLAEGRPATSADFLPHLKADDKTADHEDAEPQANSEDGFTTKGDLITGSISSPAVDTEAVRAIVAQEIERLLLSGLRNTPASPTKSAGLPDGF